MEHVTLIECLSDGNIPRRTNQQISDLQYQARKLVPMGRRMADMADLEDTQLWNDRFDDLRTAIIKNVREL